MKHDISGTEIARIVSAGGERWGGVEAAPDGTLFVTGTRASSTLGVLDTGFVMKLDSEGRFLEEIVLPDTGFGVGNLSVASSTRVYAAGATSDDLFATRDGLFDAVVMAIDFASEYFAGDFDRDGAVGFSDYELWVSTYGDFVRVPGFGADANGDQIVDAADFTVWRDHYDPESLAIPEPSALVLSFAALMASQAAVLMRRA